MPRSPLRPGPSGAARRPAGSTAATLVALAGAALIASPALAQDSRPYAPAAVTHFEAHEFVMVDIGDRTRETAFDHERLAGALSTAEDTTFEAGELPFEHFEPTEDGIRLWIGERRWDCEPHFGYAVQPEGCCQEITTRRREEGHRQSSSGPPTAAGSRRTGTTSGA